MNLHKLSSQISQYSVSYEPEVSPGLYFELPKSGVTVMLFGSGKYHLTGGEGIDQIFEANNEVNDIIGECVDEKVSENDPDIRNLVYRGDFEREFDLEELATSLENTEYNPENQPGIKYRPSDEFGLITIFRTGRFTLVGVETKEQAEDSLREFKNTITELVSD